MNTENKKKAYIEYLLSFEVLEIKDNGKCRAELRKDEKTGALAIVVFLNGEFEEAFYENIYMRKQIQAIWNNWLDN